MRRVRRVVSVLLVPLSRLLSFLRLDLASRAAALSVTSNATLLALKLVVGIITGSIAVLSDAVDSAEDLIASAFVLFSVRLAARPADAEHPYGHGKAESLTAAGQAVLISGGAGFIIFQAVRRLIERDVEIMVAPGLGAMSATALVNLLVVLYVARAARLTGSVALASDARHLWTNIAQAAAVLLALILVGATGETVFDPIVALLLSVYLLWTAFRVFSAALEEVMDVRLPPEELQAIEACILHHGDRIGGYHGLRTRKSGREKYVEFHLVVDPRMTVEDVHRTCDRIEADLHRRLPGSIVTIHVEPDDGRLRRPLRPGGVRMGGGQREQPS
jgi:cation diffusion facilitator family transporter